MPVVIKTVAKPPKIRKGRGGHFDRFVIEVAPVIQKIRSSGFNDMRRIANKLNDLGHCSSTGGHLANVSGVSASETDLAA